MKKNSCFKPLTATIMLFLILCLAQFSMVSAFEFDNSKGYDKSVGAYGKYEIKNAFGLGKDIKDIELIKNTDICGVMCSATDIITLYEKGSLVDDARFSEDVISYEFKYRKLGSNVWKDYEVGQIVEEGTYELYLIGEKLPKQSIEWEILTSGIWTEEWALWGAGSGAVSLWEFDDSNHTFLEDSIGSNDGTFSGYTFNDGAVSGATLNTTDGKFGNAYDFDGNDDSISTGKDFVADGEITDTLTMSAWVKVSSWDYGKVVMGQVTSRVHPLDLYGLYIGTANRFFFRVDTTNAQILSTSATGLSVNTWYHVTTIYNGTEQCLYINGELNGTGCTANTGNINNVTSSSFTIGNRVSELSQVSDFNGSIDEVRIWNKALTQAEIQAEMNNVNPVSSDGLISSYSFEQNNATHTFDTNNLVAGIIEEGGRFDGSSGWIDTNYEINVSRDDTTICSWINPATLPSNYQFPISASDGSLGGIEIAFKGTYIRAGYYPFQATWNGVVAGEWYHVCTISNSTHISLYVNGNGVVLDNSWTPTETHDLTIGSRYSTAWNLGFDGSIDQVGIWNRSLSEGEIELLYNAGAGIYYDVTDPVANLVSPVDSYNTTNPDITFTCNATDNQEVYNISLLIDDVIVDSADNYTLTSIQTLTEGYYNWSCEAYDVAGNYNLSETRYFNYSDANPNVTLNSPVDYYNSTSSTINFNCSATDDVGISNVSFILDGVLNETNTTGLNNTNYLFSETLTDGDYNWTCGAVDSLGQETNATERYFTIDTTEPNINITYPTETINYHVINTTLELNWTAIDTHLDSCWYNYNGTNTSVTCGDNTTTINITDYSIRNVTLYANDTFGNENSVTRSWDYLVFENSRTFSNSTLIGTLEDFTLNVTVNGIEINSGTLVYNGTSISNSITSSGEIRLIYLNNYLIPLFASDSNVTFYWTLGLSDGSSINTSSSIQNVETINLDNCSVYTNQLFNLSLFSERTKTLLNGDIEIFYEVQNEVSDNSIINLSGKFEDVNNTLVCSDINLSGEDLVYSTEIKYYADDYASELYHIQKADINGYINLSLYDLHSNYSTEFLLDYQDENSVKVEGAVVQLLRKYISEDIYEIVEAPLTSNEGKAIVHVDLDSNKYKAIIYKDGEILDIFENIVFKCQSELSGQCEQSLYASINPQNEINIDTLRDFAYSISETAGIITTTFSMPSGTPATVNVVLIQRDMFGNTTTCNKTISSSSGSTECTYNNTIGNSLLDLKITKNNIPQAIKSYVVEEDSGISFLNNNFFIVLIMLFSVIGMAFSSPEWIIINSIITLLLAGALWLLNGMNFVVGLGSIMWLVIAAGILIMKLAKQEDR